VPRPGGQALGDRLIVNDDVFNWTDLPRSVAVVGAGVIGLELAQALHRLGVRVRLFGRGGRVGPLTDPALQALARQVFGGELPLTLGAQDLQPRRDGDAVVVLRSVLSDGRVHEERFDFLLAATGRRPNVDSAGPRAHIAAARRAKASRCSTVAPARSARAPCSWRAMWPTTVRCCTRPPTKGASPATTPAATPTCACGRAARRWRWCSASRRWHWWAPATPNCCASGADFEIGEVSFADQGRSRVMGRNQGALQVYAERGSGRLLGAEMLGPAAEHMGHLLAWSVQRGDTVQQMLDSPFYHPVVEEGLRTALRDAQHKLLLPAPLPEVCLECAT
jgi:dihydrolipoamide dehydrogenase